jgi:hypothetical protein
MSVLFEILAAVAQVAIEGAFSGVVGDTKGRPPDQVRPGSNEHGEHCEVVVDNPSLQARRDNPVYQRNLQRLIERNGIV